MKPTVWTAIVALTVACLGEVLLPDFDSSAAANATVQHQTAARAELESQVQVGLNSLGILHR